MNYVVETLDELAAFFEERAKQARDEAMKPHHTLINRASFNGEANGWVNAAYIVRRTTVREATQ